MSALWAALAPEGFLAELKREAGFRKLCVVKEAGDLLVFSGAFSPLAWARVNWREARQIPVPSIGQGVKALKPLARKWAFHSAEHHRRGQLMLEQLREYKTPLTQFPDLKKEEGLAAFTLLAPDLAVALLGPDRPHPLGTVQFAEDKRAPSRAYLKLWESLALTGRVPRPGEKCIDLGASPGGWTWVIAGCGAAVLAVDRSALDPSVTAMPGVSFRKADAFQLRPAADRVDWLFSDVICYPEKLLEFTKEWVESGRARNIVFTIKFQGEVDPAVIGEFTRLGRVLHLFHNKHELTFFYFSDRRN